jgi:predicted alpha/beta superfamily hydrolase
LSSLTALSPGIPVRDELTVDELKAKISSTNVADRPHICVQIAQKELNESDRLYASADVDKAQAALTDVVTYSELARDYSLQSHRYQKQAEIAVREMTRKLNQILHTLGHDEQPPVKNAVTRLEHVRDDLLASMFKKGAR